MKKNWILNILILLFWSSLMTAIKYFMTGFESTTEIIQWFITSVVVLAIAGFIIHKRRKKIMTTTQ